MKKLEITNTPNVFSQKEINKFFRAIDMNSIGEDFRFIDVKRVRDFFYLFFKGKYEIPSFPFVDEETKIYRDKRTK